MWTRLVDLFSNSLEQFNLCSPVQQCQNTKHKSVAVVRSNRNCQASSELTGVRGSDQDQPECLENFSAVPLNEVKISQDVRPLKCCKASYARTLSLSIGSYLYSPNTCPPIGLASAKQHMNLPQQNTRRLCITVYSQKLILQTVIFRQYGGKKVK